MLEKVRKEVDFYITSDKKEFLNEDDAIYHEKSITTKYVLIGYAPDLNDTGRLTKYGVLEVVNGRFHDETIATDFCYETFGIKKAYVQGVSITKNWDVVRVITFKQFDELDDSFEIIGTIDCLKLPKN